MTEYADTTLDAPALRTLARTTAARIFPAAARPRTSWWRGLFSGPSQPPPQFRHLCERFTSGDLVKEPYFKVKEGTALRLRDDGIIECEDGRFWPHGYVPPLS